MIGYISLGILLLASLCFNLWILIMANENAARAHKFGVCFGRDQVTKAIMEGIGVKVLIVKEDYYGNKINGQVALHDLCFLLADINNDTEFLRVDDGK